MAAAPPWRPPPRRRPCARRCAGLGLATDNTAVRTSLRETFDADYAGATPYNAHSSPSGGGSPGGGSPPSGGGGTVAAAYSSDYSDWDAYVHSHEDDTTVTVTDGGGTRAGYHTSSEGDADVCLEAPESARGETVTARVGSATCTGTL